MTNDKFNNGSDSETSQSSNSLGTVSNDDASPTEDWHTLSRTASELGVGVTWLESFCKRHQLTIRKAKNPHYSSASPMKLIELNALNRCFAAEPEALANAQKRSRRARKASVTVATREKQRFVEAQQRLGEVAQLVESLGPLESSLFWFGQMAYSKNRQRFIVGASWELLGGLLASGGTLSQTKENTFWQFPSGLEMCIPRQLLKDWRWIDLLPYADRFTANENSESTVIIHEPFGRVKTVKAFDASTVHYYFLKSFATWTNRTSIISTQAYSTRFDEQVDEELSQLFVYPGNEIWERLHMTSRDAEIWQRHQFTAQQALAYIACGIGVGEAISFSEVGLDILKLPIFIIKWRNDLYRLGEWRAHGLNALFATLWANAGFSPEEGAAWNELKILPNDAAILAGHNIQGFSVHPQQVKELITNLEQIRELKFKRKQISGYLVMLLSRDRSFEDIEPVLLRLHSRDLLDSRYLRMFSHLLDNQIPILIASDLMMQLPAKTNIDARRILQSAAWLWKSRPNLETRTLIEWSSIDIKVETSLQLIDLGVSVQEAKQYRALFNRSPKTTKNVLSRIANGEALDDIAKSYQSTKKKKKKQEANRRAWAEFFRVSVQLIPPDFGPFDPVAVKSFQTGQAPVPEYILNKWNETNKIPRWAFHVLDP